MLSIPRIKQNAQHDERTIAATSLKQQFLHQNK
jgi:hypothetical protein